jgi:hypothetical protein
MVDPRQSYLQGRKRLAEETHLRQQEDRRNQKEAVEQHASEVTRSGEVINVFRNYRDIFSKHNISYGVLDFGVGYKVFVVLSKYSRHGAKKTAFVAVPPTQGRAFQLVNFDHDGGTTKSDLPSDTVEMVGEILRLLGNGKFVYSNLSESDIDFEGHKINYHFVPGRMVKGYVIFLVLSIVVTILLLSAFQ